MARFPTPAVPEPPVVLAGQPVGASGPQAASVQAQQVPRAQRVRPVLRVR